jgi:hypothetical protein
MASNLLSLPTTCPVCRMSDDVEIYRANDDGMIGLVCKRCGRAYLTFRIFEKILAHMPDVTSPKKNGTHEAGSLSRVRFEAMLLTGLPPVQLARLQPHLIDWASPAMLVPPRQKGQRTRRARTYRHDRPRPPRCRSETPPTASHCPVECRRSCPGDAIPCGFIPTT